MGDVVFRLSPTEQAELDAQALRLVEYIYLHEPGVKIHLSRLEKPWGWTPVIRVIPDGVRDWLAEDFDAPDRLMLAGRNGTAHRLDAPDRLMLAHRLEPERLEECACPLPAGWAERPSVVVIDDRAALVLGERVRLPSRSAAELLRALVSAPAGLGYYELKSIAKDAHGIISRLFSSIHYGHLWRRAIDKPFGKNAGLTRIRTYIESAELN